VGQARGQFAFDQVTDHAFGFGAQNIEAPVPAGYRRLQGQQADLGAVVVGDDEIVFLPKPRQGAGRNGDIALLGWAVQGLATPQQRVPAEGRNDPHQPVRPSQKAAMTSPRPGRSRSSNS
jgi:hypothetical protein